jgi:hypothetical protein
MAYQEKKTTHCYFADVFSNPPETIEKFGNEYRTLTVVNLEGKSLKIDYKKTRPEAGLEPGNRVLVKSVTTGQCTWDEVVPFSPSDPDLSTFNPTEFTFVKRELERESNRDSGNIQWMITSDPLVRIRKRMQAWEESNGETRDDILKHTNDYIGLYADIYQQVFDKFGKPIFETDEFGVPIPDEYGELTLKRPAMDGYGLRDITGKALASASKKFNL